MNKNTKLILNWIARYWYPSISESTRNYVLDTWITQVTKWIKHNGILHTIKRIKMLRLTVTRYMCHQPLLVNDMMIGISKEGFPKSIIYMKDLMDSNSNEAIRFTLTCLGISRSFDFKAEPKYNSITDPFTGSFKTIDKDFIITFCKDYTKMFEINDPTPSGLFLSLKSGPRSGPAILQAVQSAHAFTGMNLWGLRGLTSVRFLEWVKSLKLSQKASPIKHPKSSDIIGNRKLHIIHDPEAKARVIAIFDYISQVAFNPLSEYLFNTLRAIPQDRTFTQDPTINDKDDGQSFHSFDLSAATDRFPIQLQEDLLSEIASPYYAKSWKNLMVNEPFMTPDGNKIKYSVGQPMGARSSWAMFTLSHHLVVQYAAYQANQYPFNKYILLGDDIVIYDNKVADNYLQLITGLGVQISTAKSHISKDTYEFAKRWFHKGIEVSPVPINGILDNLRNPKLLFAQILDLIYAGRGPKTIVCSVEMVMKLYWALGGYSKTQQKQLSKLFTELRFIYRNLKDFDYQLTREFFANWTKSNEYPIPSDPVILLNEFNRAGAGVVNGMAMSIVKKLSTYYKNFVGKFEEFINVSETSPSPSVMNIHPLTGAMYNSIVAFSNMNKELMYTTNLQAQLETVTLLDLDKLANRERLSKDRIFTFSSFARKLAYQMEQDPDLIIAKARTMQFGRGLLDIKLAMAKANPNLKSGSWT